jgi:hypothetical protein
MSEDGRRVQAHTLFRLINEKMHGLNVAFRPITADAEVVCECVDMNCIAQIVLPFSTYADFSRDPGHFIVVTGHADPVLDEVVTHRDGWELVRSTLPAGLDTAEESQLPLS